MILDFNFKFTELSGKVMKGDDEQCHAGVLLANGLASASSDDPIKFFHWGIKLYAKESLDLDKSDVEKLEKFVKEKWNVVNLAKAQVLEVIKNASLEDSAKKPSKAKKPE